MSALQSLIPVVNKLQDIVTNANLTDLDLPLLTVIGSQSAGKSSVLENIVGKDFLPRGTGIVTRRPLVLQLINIKEDDPIIHKMGVETDQDPETLTLEDHLRNSMGTAELPNEWAEFLHIPGKRFYSFENVKREIEHETARVAGKNKGISRVPINLKIYSPNVLNLTMVDLPGLTKIPIGDQPTDIERQIKNLVLEYISKPNSVILAVSPANVDLVNSEALKLARQVDPQGKRTIGILSKLDLMDHGTNAMEILTGKVYPLRLGFVGVVNRSQQDISTNKTLEDSLVAETDFFRKHPAYRNIAARCGTDYLARKLHETLMEHIRERLPDIKAKLNTLMGQTEQELLSYGDTDRVTEENRGALILQLMNKFSTAFLNSIEGNSPDISTKELCGGARIYYVYNEVLGRSLRQINPLENLSIQDIRTAIRNSTGPRPSLFVPELAFDLLVKPQIKLLEGPAHRCVELVYEELMKICHNCGPKELGRYPKLHTKLIEVVSDLLRERLSPTSAYIQGMIDINRAYINTNHPDFIGAANAMAYVVNDRQRERMKQASAKDTAAAAAQVTTPDPEQLNVQKNKKSSSSPAKNDSPVTHDDHSPSKTNGTANGNSNSSAKAADGSKSSSSPAKDTTVGGGDVTAINVNVTTNGPSESDSPERDSFLNFFFGKDQSPSKQILQQVQEDQVLQQEVQLRREPKPTLGPPPKRIPSSQIGNDSFTFAPQPPLQFRSNEPSVEEQMEHLSVVDTLGEREQLECELIKRLIVSYFGIVRQTIQDQVPKAIMCLLVNYSRDTIQNTLVQKLYKESLFDELLFEDETLSQEREKCRQLLQTYRAAAEIISEVV